jgi:enamine deaminase RidA (YjgF/YER057c/UK114 family)
MSAPTEFEFLNPAQWKKPRGYANGVVALGRVAYLGGQIGWNANQEFETDDFSGQTHQALANIVALLKEARLGPEHLVRLTWYVTSKADYLNALGDIGKSYRELIGKHYPAMTLVQVVALVEDRAVVEIEATAVMPI